MFLYYATVEVAVSAVAIEGTYDAYRNGGK